MKEAIDKLSSYNLFNYLLPGVLFVVIAKHLTNTDFSDENIIFTLFICYFFGLVISRLGSLIIEPSLKILGVLKFSQYERYIKASRTDPLISTLSETNNMYRTMISLFISLLFYALFDYLVSNYPLLYEFRLYVLLGLLVILFTFSYIKQTAYVTKRVESYDKEIR